MVEFWRPEALKLRNCFKYYLFMHLIFLIGDIFIYNLEILCILADILLLYSNYYNYMTLFKPMIIF